jgi:NarL family two-component system response regulator LiaR
VIAPTSFKEQALVQQALEAGAIGYLLKDVGPKDLAKAIRAAYKGQPTLDPEAAWTLFKAACRAPALGDDLTDRERQVLALMAEGLSHLEIANRLVIGDSTIKTHVSNILSKLGVTSRTEAVSLALKKNLIH